MASLPQSKTKSPSRADDDDRPSCRGYDVLVGWKLRREDCPDEADALPGEEHCAACFERSAQTARQDEYARGE
jgi:hypothetical protein